LSLRTVQRHWRVAVHLFGDQKGASVHPSAGGDVRCLVKRPGATRYSHHLHTATSTGRSSIQLPQLPRRRRPPSPVDSVPWRGTVVQVPGLGPLGKVRIVPPPDPVAGRDSPPPVPGFVRRYRCPRSGETTRGRQLAT
jgi:hypothetical protein